MTTKHIAVLLQETLDILAVEPGKVYLDATLGGGGHSQEIIKHLHGRGTLLCIDQDEAALENFGLKLEKLGFSQKTNRNYQQGGLTVKLLQENFSHLQTVLTQTGIRHLDGIIADLGISSDQLADINRGFSFLQQAPLDMRMNKQLSVKASDLLNGLFEKELITLFSKLSDISFAKKLTKEIINYRKQRLFHNTNELTQLVRQVVPINLRKGTNKHPEAKVFQALRIAVNNELGALQTFLPQAVEALNPGGKLVVISFHSGEDRIVKNYFKGVVANGTAAYVNKLLKPTRVEIAHNPRSSSAKLRAIVKLDGNNNAIIQVM